MAFNQTTKQVAATISKIDGKTLRAAIQTGVVHVIGHAMQYGHSPLANTLMDRMNTSPMLKKHAKAVTTFLVSFGPFSHSKDTGFVFNKAKRDTLNDEGYDFDSFVENAAMWDEVSRDEPKAVTFDVFAELGKLIKKARAKELDGQCIDAKLIDYLAALSGQYAGRKAVEAARAAAEAHDRARTAEIAALMPQGPEVEAINDADVALMDETVALATA